MSEAPVEMRVGDRERRAVDDQLQAAVGDGALTLSEYDERSGLLWKARTRSELDALVADLPVLHPGQPHAPLPAATTPRRVVAVMSEDRLSGVVRPGQEVRGYALMGKAVVDLRREDLPDGTRVKVRSLMGEVEVQVPPGTQVELSGMAVMGDRKVRVAPGDGPTVHVDAYALMGSINVTVGDGQVLKAVRGAAPVQRQATGHLQHATHHARHDQAAPPAVRTRGLARRLSGMKGLLVPAALVGGLLIAGPDNTSVFGSNVEKVTSSEDSVQVSTLFGSVEVVVPNDVQVDTSGLVVFGSVDCKTACTKDDGRVVKVRSVGGFGSVSIRTQAEHDAKNEADAAEEAAEDAEDADD
jgi:hypothetical protein